MQGQSPQERICILLKQYRLMHKMTQQQAAKALGLTAKALGLTASAYGKIELGLRNMAPEYYAPACRALGIPRMKLLDALVPPDINNNDTETERSI